MTLKLHGISEVGAHVYQVNKYVIDSVSPGTYQNSNKIFRKGGILYNLHFALYNFCLLNP